MAGVMLGALLIVQEGSLTQSAGEPKFGVVNLGFRYALREENGATSAVHPESPL